MKNNKNTVLVALLKSESDFKIAKTRHWYRIPLKSAPPIVRNYEIKYIAFYHTKKFKKEQYSIRWYAKVTRVIVLKRKVLFPNNRNDSKANDFYFKIEFEPLQLLPNPIISLRQRVRIVFIPTTEEKLFNSKEINYLYSDSYLEDKLWEKFVEKEIFPERQFNLTIDRSKFILDFAVFCKVRNIDIECDGNKYHTQIKEVFADKRRNNILESAGWSVLRFTTDDIEHKMKDTMNLVNETINEYGGVQDIKDSFNYKYIPLDDNQQMTLFD